MKPARFDYQAPQSVEEALAALAAHGEDAKIIAGGQSLVPMMNMRLAQPPVLIDINALPDLASVRDEGQHLAIGALIRHHDLAHHEIVRALCPVLAEAAATIGYYAIRQRGTLGGSLVQADPAAQLPLIAVLLDAEMELASLVGSRRVPASDFFLSVFTTSIEPTEILTACRVPKRSAARLRIGAPTKAGALQCSPQSRAIMRSRPRRRRFAVTPKGGSPNCASLSEALALSLCVSALRLHSARSHLRPGSRPSL